MAKAFSFDLRVRVLAAVGEGASHRAAAARFGVSAASVSRWRRRAEVQGEPRPGALGGDRRSAHVEAHRDLIIGTLADTPDITIEELRRSLAGRGFGYGAIQRFLVRHPARHDCALRARWADQPRRLRDLCREGPGPRTAHLRHRHHGQPVEPQGREGPRENRAAGAELLFLLPYSPDLNPIEMAFSKLKALLRKAAQRTVDGLWAAIARLIETFAPQECRNYFAAAGYDPDR